MFIVTSSVSHSLLFVFNCFLLGSGTHPNRSILFRLAERIRPRLDQLQHFRPDILVLGGVDQCHKHFTVGLVRDLLVNWNATIFHNTLEGQQRIVAEMKCRKGYIKRFWS
jgi:hypothetical protein